MEVRKRTICLAICLGDIPAVVVAGRQDLGSKKFFLITLKKLRKKKINSKVKSLNLVKYDPQKS